jgi:hypothetical protein
LILNHPSLIDKPEKGTKKKRPQRHRGDERIRVYIIFVIKRKKFRLYILKYFIYNLNEVVCVVNYI